MDKNTNLLLSFSTGRHPCLYCTVTKKQMQLSLNSRSKSPLRTLSTLKDDYRRFIVDGGGDIKNAKFFNNVINEALFNIPINQVRNNSVVEHSAPILNRNKNDNIFHLSRLVYQVFISLLDAISSFLTCSKTGVT